MDDKRNADLDISRASPSLAWLLGGLIPITLHLGRAIAVVGALVTGFICLHPTTMTDTWPKLAVAGAIFSALAVGCRR